MTETTHSRTPIFCVVPDAAVRSQDAILRLRASRPLSNRCAHGEGTAYDQSCQSGDLEFTCEPKVFTCIGTALAYHEDARSEFRFDGLRDPDTPAEQPLSRAERPATSTSTGFFVFGFVHIGSVRPAASMQSAVRDSALRPAPPTVVPFLQGKHGGPAGQASCLEPCAIGRTRFRTMRNVFERIA